MPQRLIWSTLLLAGATLARAVTVPDEDPSIAPREFTYKTVNGTALRACVFAPPAAAPGSAPRPAVAIFHGGGWSIGEAGWTFGDARRFASAGYVGIGFQYRLSSLDRDDVTPLDAIADARDAIRWIRRRAAELGIDPHRVVALGWSAGGHLAACTAGLVDPLAEAEVSAVPDALVLWFPALDLSYDGWIVKLLHGRADRRQISPDTYVRAGLPPTLVLHGRLDTITPLAGAEHFVALSRAAGNRCELHVYDQVAHSFEDRPGHVDEAVSTDSKRRTLAFLQAVGIAPAAAVNNR